MSGKQPTLNGLIVARYAEDFGLSGDQAWRMFREGSPEFRKIMTDWYSVRARKVVRDLQFEDPDLYDIHMDSAQLDADREHGTGAYAKPEPRRGRPDAETLNAVAANATHDDYPGNKHANTCYADSSPTRRAVLLASPPNRWDATDPRNMQSDDECPCGCAEPK